MAFVVGLVLGAALMVALPLAWILYENRDRL
jgi:hypothetical protein